MRVRLAVQLSDVVTTGGGLLTLGGLSMWTEGDASLRSAGTLTFLGIPMTLDATVVHTGSQVGADTGFGTGLSGKD